MKINKINIYKGDLNYMARFFSKKVTLDNGDVFDSQTEYEWWKMLLKKQEQGLISELKRQVPFLLQEAFKTKDGKSIRKMEYIADFTYLENGELHIVDSKGAIACIEETFKIKWKIMRYKYPDYNYHIIIRDKSKTWTDLENKADVKGMKEREKAIPKKTKKK
jgi:hypothetical protein